MKRRFKGGKGSYSFWISASCFSCVSSSVLAVKGKHRIILGLGLIQDFLSHRKIHLLPNARCMFGGFHRVRAVSPRFWVSHCLMMRLGCVWGQFGCWTTSGGLSARDPRMSGLFWRRCKWNSDQGTLRETLHVAAAHLRFQPYRPIFLSHSHLAFLFSLGCCLSKG